MLKKLSKCEIHKENINSMSLLYIDGKTMSIKTHKMHNKKCK